MEKLKELWATKKPVVIGVGVAVVAVIVYFVGRAKGWFGGASKRNF